MAYLDGKNRNPSAIFNRGYYAGSFVGAYDFDGYTLKERWISRNTTSGKGLWGEGAHWLTAADLDNDGSMKFNSVRQLLTITANCFTEQA